jgi:hypothetical protein
LIREKHKEEEVKKLGNLRAGNSGAMSPEGEIIGCCPRKTHLRQLGIEIDEPSDSLLIMFQMGTANEDVVYHDLMQTKTEDEIILRESEIPIRWNTSNGTKVTGRPDMVICKRGEDGITKPEWGIELKSVASVWTSKDVLFGDVPKLEHLIQCSHYAWKLGVPFLLLYKQYTNQVVPQWAQKFFPRKGDKHSEHVEYNDKGDIKNIKPFEISYEVSTDATGRVSYRREGQEEWGRTILSVQDIERFYEFVSRMAEDKNVGPKPLALDPMGNKKNYSVCNYCPPEILCNSAESMGYDNWLAKVRENLAKGS